MDTENRHSLEKFKSAISIIEVAKDLGLEPMRGKVRCWHPTRHANGDRTPSVSLSQEKGLFKCFVCPDVKGDVIELVCQVRNVRFGQAIDWLAEQYPQAAVYLYTKSETPSWSGTDQVLKNQNTTSSSSDASSIPPWQAQDPLWKPKMILEFLRMLAPVHSENSKTMLAQKYLVRRKIFQKTWVRMRIRWVEDYGYVNQALRQRYPLEQLQAAGLMNENGNLKFYRHRLILPYLDEANRPVHFQARTLEPDVTPKELSLKGSIPFPYNANELNGQPGLVYLCEGPIDALTLIEKGLPAVAVPGVSHFKSNWIPLFQNKTVVLCFDHDTAGQKASEALIPLLEQHGIRSMPVQGLPEGKDINAWFGGDKAIGA